MIELTIFLALVLLYVFINRHEPFSMHVASAMVLAAIYLAIYLLIPPKLEITSMRLGQLFGYVPMVSFGAILFPSLNTRSPVQVTRFLGWFGLIVVFSILCILKLFVW